MKKILNYSLILALSLVSCWEESSPNEYEAFGVIEENSGKLCMRSDNGSLLVPTKAISAYAGHGDRAWMLFSADKAPQENEIIEVDLYDITKLHECALQTEGADTLGNDGVQLNRIWIAQDFLTLDMMVVAYDEYALKKHDFVVYHEMRTRNDTLYMQFRHKARSTGNKDDLLRTGATLRLANLQVGREPVVIAMRITDLDNKATTHYCTYQRITE